MRPAHRGPCRRMADQGRAGRFVGAMRRTGAGCLIGRSASRRPLRSRYDSDYYAPRWYGSPEQLHDCIERAVPNTKAALGDTMYARMNWSMHADDMFDDGQASWPQMRSGFERTIIPIRGTSINSPILLVWRKTRRRWPNSPIESGRNRWRRPGTGPKVCTFNVHAWRGKCFADERFSRPTNHTRVTSKGVPCSSAKTQRVCNQRPQSCGSFLQRPEICHRMPGGLGLGRSFRPAEPFKDTT